MPEEMNSKISVLEGKLRKGFSAFNVLLEQLTGRVNSALNAQTVLTQKQDQNESDIAKLTERVAKLEGHKEGVRDGREDTSRTLAEVKEVRQGFHEEKKVEVEKWKATAPIIIAVLSGIFGLITGIIALLSALFGGHSGH